MQRVGIWHLFYAVVNFETLAREAKRLEIVLGVEHVEECCGLTGRYLCDVPFFFSCTPYSQYVIGQCSRKHV